MLVSKLFFFLAPLTLAASLEPRETPAQGAQAILADIGSIADSITTLNNSVNQLVVNDPLAVTKALTIQQDVTALGNALKKAIADANASPKLNDNLSNKVSTAILKLEPKIRSLLNNIVVHKPAFATAVLLVGDLSKTVEKSLKQQKNLTKQFAAAITAKLSKAYAAAAPAITKQILGYFKIAIKAYKNCTGTICLPPIPAVGPL